MSTHRSSKLPPITDIAARVRAGEVLAEIAAECGVSHKTLLDRLSIAGFGSTGVPRAKEQRHEMRTYLQTALLRWVEPWMEHAECARVDPDLWYPDKGDGKSYRAAREICLTKCPVLEECGKYAADHGERFGIWAGMGERDRQRARKERAA